MLAYMFSYCWSSAVRTLFVCADCSLDGIASALSMGVLNYILLGMQFHIDNFYMRGFELWLACFVLFLGAGNISFTIMEYRLGNRSIVSRVVVVSM